MIGPAGISWLHWFGILFFFVWIGGWGYVIAHFILKFW